MESIEELEKKCGIKYDGAWRKNFTRKISMYFTRILVHTSVTPNQLTILFIILGVIAAGFFMNGEYISSLIGILFLNLAILLDFCDGSVARYKKKESHKGIYLDLMGHNVVNSLVLIGITIGAYSNDFFNIPSSIFLIAGLIGVYSMMMKSLIKFEKYKSYIILGEFDKLKEYAKHNKSIIANSKKSTIKAEIREFFIISRVFNAILFFGIFNLLPFLVLIYGFLFSVNTLKGMIFEIKSANL